MGKNNPFHVLKVVFKDISNMESVIRDSKKVEKSCKVANFKDQKEVDKIVADTKTIVDSLKSQVVKIDKYFDENYQSWKSEPSTTDDSASTEAGSPLVNDASKDKPVDQVVVEEGKTISNTNTLASSGKESNEKELQPNEKELQPNEKETELSEKETNLNEENKSVEKETVPNEKETVLNEKEAELNTNEIEPGANTFQNQDDEAELNTNEIEPGANTFQNQDDDTACGDTENCIDAEAASDKSTSAETKVFIKCVDIKKLIMPNVSHLKSPSPTRNNGLNDSICVISDSDQDDMQKSTNRKKNSLAQKEQKSKGKKDDSTLKNNRKEPKETFTISESDSDSIANVAKEKTKSSKNFKGKSNETDSKSLAKKSSNKQISKHIRSKKTLDCESLSDMSNSDESDNIGTTTKRSEKSVQNKSTKRKGRSRNSTKESLIIDAQSDKKFSYEAYVPLPRIPCHKLKKFYLKKIERDEIKRLTDLDNLKKRRRRSGKKDEQGTSSDTENIKPRSKRKRKTSHNSHPSSADSSDEEASSSTDDIKSKITKAAAAPSSKEFINKDDNDQIEKMIVDGICSSSDASSNESASESKKSKKTSKKNKDDKKKDKSQASDERVSDVEKKKEEGKWRKDKLLTGKLSDSGSEDEFAKFKKRNEKAKEDVRARLSKKKGKHVIDSDSDSDSKRKSSQETSSSSSENEAEKNTEEETKTRRRIKKIKDSSSEEEADKSTRKNLRRVIGHASLAETTKQAEKEEKERKARIAERQKKYNKIFDEDKPEDASVDKVVLDFNAETKEETLVVHKDLVKKLKPHQAKGIQFMWDACYESLKRAKKTDGSGCILAHCMGLGKTLQVIALAHTLLVNEITGVKRVLVVCPVSTVLNWVAEFKKWLDDLDGPEIEVLELIANKNISERQYQVEHWYKHGGVFVLGYDMFRNLTNPTNKRLRKSAREVFHKGLVNPGPDLVICDEGHLLKNEKSNLSVAMNRIHTVRRIVLTGTPMQNNMKEYYCMVQFVKPNLLGTYKEYLNRFVNPITNGQYTDSTPHDIGIMRKRSHVLHKLLDGIVQRKDYSVLTPYLPPKHEYVLFLTLTEVQIKLYQHYKDNYSQRPVSKQRATFLFMDFQEFQRICTHPRVLLNKSEELKRKAMFEDDEDDSEGSLKDFIDDSNDESSSKSTSSKSDSDDSDGKSVKSDDKNEKANKGPQKRMTRNSAAAAGIDVEEVALSYGKSDENEWWRQYCDGDELDNIALSSKLTLLFEILQQCELIGDKLLVFSQSLYSLSIIEYFLAKIDEATQKGENGQFGGFSGSWALGLDYFRLDGSSSCDNRSAWCKNFNNLDNPRARLFLISTRAGGLGINLVGANRVIIFDVSWNPSHDIQSIYRIYRFGQEKPCYVYRFVTLGTMEMKVYERQVTKQAISKRVIDEQQIDRHYNQNDLAELYNFDPKPGEQPIPLVPKDVLLAELLQKEKDRIYKYHEHQTLLENKEDEELNEAERKAAWEEFENEKTVRVVPAANSNMGWIRNLPLSSVSAALVNIIKKDNPSWTIEQIQSVVPTIVQQLREQVDAGEMLLFNRIVNEMRLMQAAQQQRMQEYYMRQQIQLLQQQQNQLANTAGLSLNVGSMIQSALTAGQNVPNNSNEVVELND